jgi:predicted RNA-binding protein YlqC (UPF0109 family)
MNVCISEALIENWYCKVDSEMGSDTQMKDLVEFVAKALVDEVGKIEISEIAGNQTNIIELKVAKEDIGKVIGKRGIHADAIRRIVHAIGGKHKKRYLLEILEQSGIVAPTAADS